MRKIKNGSKKVIWGICASLSLWTLATRGSTLPPDPNNAALLYYRAVALWSNVRLSYVGANTVEGPNENSEVRRSTSDPKRDEMYALYEKMMREYEREHGKEQREASRQFKRRQTIDIIEAASRIPQCSWGMKEWGLPPLGSLHHLALLLEDDAKVLVANGQYRKALDRCLTIRRFARHLGDEAFFVHSVSMMVDGVAFRGIRHILCSMPSDIEALTWLKDQLATTPGVSLSPVRALKIDIELALQNLHTHPETIARIRNRLTDEAAFRTPKEEIRSLTDERMVALIQKHASSVFDSFFESVNRIFESDKPYAQRYSEIDLLTYKLREHDCLVPLYDLTTVMLTPRSCELTVNLRTHINAVKAAIEIYLLKAKTGELPEALPNGLPKDPFSGRDFGYEITEGGFALRCQGTAFQKGRLRRSLEFKVCKRN